MKLITDEILHFYVKNPGSLEPEIKNYIDKLIISDENFRQRVKETEEFYSEFENTEIDFDVESYLTNKIELFPMNNICQNKHKIAASVKTIPVDEYKYINTFISADNLVLIRVHKNEKTNEYKINLVCEDMDKVDSAVMIIDDERYTADKNGVVVIKDKDIDKFTRISVLLRK